ncbi:thioredoxin family protein [Nocardiopsis sp. YSL2]|uniref:DF family (seleno)protein n=1 Tax=Nocardiopsis sp. YSL2 TaxID=2939492 RepID=UPI0026F442E9|nr:thioredoxin family protein [Nocardiopsis sp. YSL2]
MEVELLYFSGCPNWRVAQERLIEALRLTGHAEQPIALVEVDTDERARQLRFPGSPTIRLDGRDALPTPVQNHGMSCRVYAGPDGLSGAPSLDQLVRVLTDGP